MEDRGDGGDTALPLQHLTLCLTNKKQNQAGPGDGHPSQHLDGDAGGTDAGPGSHRETSPRVSLPSPRFSVIAGSLKAAAVGVLTPWKQVTHPGKLVVKHLSAHVGACACFSIRRDLNPCPGASGCNRPAFEADVSALFTFTAVDPALRLTQTLANFIPPKG